MDCSLLQSFNLLPKDLIGKTLEDFYEEQKEILLYARDFSIEKGNYSKLIRFNTKFEILMKKHYTDFIDVYTLQSMQSVGLPEKDIKAFGESQRQKQIEILEEELYGVKKRG